MEEIQLKDICDLDNGYAFKSDDYVDNSNTLNCRMSNIRPDGSFDILYSAKYLPNEFAEKFKDYILHDGDLIIAMTDMAGDPKILGVPTVVDTQGFCLLLNQRVGRLRFIREGVNADYLKLALQCPKVRTYLKRFAGGGVQLNVSKKDILSAPVCMRNEEEQDHIAGLFKRVLEVKIKREQELQLLDNLIKARFVEMFGDPTTNPKGYINLTVAEAIEAGYIEKPFDGNHGSKHPKASEYVESGIPFLMANNVIDGNVDLTNCSFITEERANKLDKGFAKNQDVLITHKGTIGRTAVLRTDYEFVMLTPQVAAYRVKKGITPDYLCSYFTTEFFQNDMRLLAAAGGSTRAYAGITAQLQLRLIIPPLDEQKVYTDFIKQVDKSKFIQQII